MSRASGGARNGRIPIDLRAVAGDPRYSNRCLLPGNEPCTRSDLPITIGFHRNGEWRSRPRSQTPDNLKALGVTCRSTTSGRATHPQPPQKYSRRRGKADRAFVDRLGIDPHHSALVGAIVAIADAFGLEVTAEGVENQDQLAILKRLGCRRGQGFYLARPMPAADMNQFVAKSYRWQVE